MKHKIADLEGAQLDAAVAKAEGVTLIERPKPQREMTPVWSSAGTFADTYTPSTSWGQGGPLIERERIMLTSYIDGDWEALAIGPDRLVERMESGRMRGPTPLIAAMRAFVASKFGVEIYLP